MEKCKTQANFVKRGYFLHGSVCSIFIFIFLWILGHAEMSNF
jgi:hypothetical protein